MHGTNHWIQGTAGGREQGRLVTLNSSAFHPVSAGGGVANAFSRGKGPLRTGEDSIAPPRCLLTKPERFRKTAFAEPARGAFGNAQRKNLAGPRYGDFDANLSEDISLTVPDPGANSNSP